MWWAWIANAMRRAGGYLTWLGAAIAGAAFLIFGHRRKVNRAEQQGRTDGAAIERDRIQQETEKATEYLEQRADEIEREINDSTADPDDLRQRMRAGARDRSAEP